MDMGIYAQNALNTLSFLLVIWSPFANLNVPLYILKWLFFPFSVPFLCSSPKNTLSNNENYNPSQSIKCWEAPNQT